MRQTVGTSLTKGEYLKALGEAHCIICKIKINPAFKPYLYGTVKNLLDYEIKHCQNIFPSSIIFLLQIDADPHKQDEVFAELIKSIREPMRRGGRGTALADAHPTFNLVINLFDLAGQLDYRLDCIDNIDLCILNQRDELSKMIKKWMTPKITGVLRQAIEKIPGSYEPFKNNYIKIIQKVLGFIYQEIKC